MPKMIQFPIDDKLYARLKAKLSVLGVHQVQFITNLIVAALK